MQIIEPIFHIRPRFSALLLAASVTALPLVPGQAAPMPDAADASKPVTVTEDGEGFTLSNGLLVAGIDKRSGTLFSLTYRGLELLARNHPGSDGGYWSSVGRGRPGGQHAAAVRINPADNSGQRAEVSTRLFNQPDSPAAPVDVDYRYSLGRGDHWLYVYSVLEHKPGYPGFGVGEARYCLKLNPDVFDYLYVDAARHRLMPNGYDWDHGDPLNLKEARRMTTGVHKGEPEHKYDYSAVFSETPAYGWSSTKQNVGLWLINPSMEYLGGGPTKAELTGHLDVNPGGLPTLLNMWVGSHYGGTTVSVPTNEAWTKVVGPFLLYCNYGPNGPGAKSRSKTSATQSTARIEAAQQAMWKDACDQASREAQLWPYAWVQELNYPLDSSRATVSGELVLKDPFDQKAAMSNVWVGVTAPDYAAARFGFGFGARGMRTNNWRQGAAFTNSAARRFGFGAGRVGFPPLVDWQRDAKYYQFWSRADSRGHFTLRQVRPGAYTLHAFADGVLGEFSLTNLIVTPGQSNFLGHLQWTPARFGATVWQIGIPDRTAREFRHGDHYWQWGLYFDYPREFPNDVNFVVGKSDWRHDWNYVQPPRIETRDLAVVGEEEEQNENGSSPRSDPAGRSIRSSTWSISFTMPEPPRGRATLRLAFCGTHAGCNVEAFVNGKSIGDTGILPSTSAMQRDGIRGYWVEKALSFDASWMHAGENSVKLLSHANTWSQGVMYDCVRLELNEALTGAPQAKTQ